MAPALALGDNARRMDSVTIIGIAGGSCSGKTRLLRRLRDALGGATCSVMLQDDYYHSRPEAQADNLAFNFDHPDALDFDYLARDLARLKQGSDIESPRYDFARHERLGDQVRAVPARPVVLVDGILILASAVARHAIDHGVFIECDAETRLERRIARDVAERGRERDNVIAQFEQQVEPMHQRFVEPSARYANTVFDQDALNGDAALEQMVRFCRKLPGVD
ncbi:MAG: uridine kinase [Pseudomonadota bacterium]